MASVGIRINGFVQVHKFPKREGINDEFHIPPRQIGGQLSGELATYLAGRYVEFVIYPFSFREFVDLYKTVYPDADTRQCFNQYLTMGGMPYLANLR